MKRVFALLLAMLLAAPTFAMAEVAVDVQGFWYSEESDDGIDLKKGKVTIYNVDGESIAEGAYQAASDKFSFDAGGKTYNCTVHGNGMLVDSGDGIKHYGRDGIEENYWTSTIDDSAIELYGGRAWQYNNDGDLVGEGTYEIDENVVTMTIGDKTTTGVIQDGEMTVDGHVYSIL